MMQYRFCGCSGLQLPVLSLGMWHNFGGVDCFETGRSIIRRAFDRGITHFDLANNYGPPPGSAESNFGRIVASDLASHRDEIVVSSKAGHLMWDGPYGDGGSRKHIFASIDQSLRRTGLDYFDIFYSHRYCPETPLEETIQALIDVVRAGKALYVGLSKYPADKAAEACRMMREQHVRCLIYQDKYNIFDREPAAEHFDLCADTGMGFISFSPLAQGLLTNRYLNGIPEDSRAARPTGYLRRDQVTRQVVERITRLDAIARGRGQSLAQMSLAWLLSQHQVSSVIVGASSVAQLDDSLDCLENISFSSGELEAIDSACK